MACPGGFAPLGWPFYRRFTGVRRGEPRRPGCFGLTDPVLDASVLALPEFQRFEPGQLLRQVDQPGRLGDPGGRGH
jgi:hypothetical protein